jgi:hypothetical protein
MRRFVDIHYRAARFLAGVPPDTLGAMVLFALEHPGLIAIFVAVVFSVLKFVVVVVLSVLEFVVVAILGSIVTWYVAKMLAIHAWPKLPSKLRQMLRRMVDRALMRPPVQDRGNSRESESAFSRNSKRHPHW